MIIGSTMLIAALSPQIRQKISGFITGQMNRQNSKNNMFDASNVGNMVKQALGGGNNQERSQNQSQQQNDRQHQHAGAQQTQHQHTQTQTETAAKKRQPHYAEPIQFEQSAMNVMDDNTMMEMLEDLEPGR
ncbi:hypothetical protein MOB78_11635 [Bacillus spizizenii]|nr:hypothetical protein [Bacillus spizizenii]